MFTSPIGVSNEEPQATPTEDKPGYIQGFLNDVKEEVGLDFTSKRPAASPGKDTGATSAAATTRPAFEDKPPPSMVSREEILTEIDQKLSGHREELHAQISEDSWKHRSALDSHHDELYDKLVGCLLTSQAEFQQHLSHLDSHVQDVDVRLTDATSHLESVATLAGTRASAEEFANLAGITAGKANTDDVLHMESRLAEQRAALDAHREALQTRNAGISELADTVAGKASAEHLDRLESGLAEQRAALQELQTRTGAMARRTEQLATDSCGFVAASQFQELAEVVRSKVNTSSLSELADAIADKASAEQFGRLETELAKQAAGMESVRSELRAEITQEADRQRKELMESLQGFVSLKRFQELSEIARGKVDVTECRDLARSVESKATAESLLELADVVAGKISSEQLSELDARWEELHRQSQESSAQILKCSAQLEALDASLDLKASAGDLEPLSDAASKAGAEVGQLGARLESLHKQLLQTYGQQRSSMDVLREEQHARVDELARKHEQLSNIMRCMTKEFDDLVRDVGTKASRGDLSARVHKILDVTSARSAPEIPPNIEIALPPEPKPRRACCGVGGDEDDASGPMARRQQQPICIEKHIKHAMANVDTGPKKFTIKPGSPRPCSSTRNLGSPRQPKR